MNDEIRREVERIAGLASEDLRREYLAQAEVQIAFGDVFMRRRLAQKTQEAALGGLTPTEVELLENTARADSRAMPDSAKKKKMVPVRGVTYSRMYKGRLVEVKSVGYGQFEYEGKIYGSLTACVKAITGTHFSGVKFFKEGGMSCSR